MNDIAHDILERASKGDISAFEQIYRTASSFVYNVALRMTCHGADAEEVTQEVFIKIYRYLKYFRFSSTFKTWVYRVTINTAINYCRKNAKEEQRRVDNEYMLDHIPADSLTDEKALQSDAKERVDRLLEMLTPEHRACLVLREIAGLNYREMAVALKVPINTVRSRLNRARQSLAEQARKEPIKNDMR